MYEINLLLFLTEIANARERILYLDLTTSSHVMRRPRFHVQRARRRFWIRPGRTCAWWDSFVTNLVLPEEWTENFRMSRDTFLSLCEHLGPHIERKSSRMQDPVEVDRQVALTLYYLADEGRMRKTANSFGLSRSSVSIIIRRVCKACEHLGPQLISLPTTEAEVQEKTKHFFERFQFPQCLGAVDAIDIKQPSHNATDYVNRKSRFSINV